MRVREFYLNSEHEVIVKIVKEVLNLFRIEIADEDAEPVDFAVLSIENEVLSRKPPEVQTRLSVQRTDGTKQSFVLAENAALDEHESAAIHRLIKLNLYHLFREHFAMPPAPWGIMHGVRPTKIVHRLIQGEHRQRQSLNACRKIMK